MRFIIHDGLYVTWCSSSRLGWNSGVSRKFVLVFGTSLIRDFLEAGLSFGIVVSSLELLVDGSVVI